MDLICITWSAHLTLISVFPSAPRSSFPVGNLGVQPYDSIVSFASLLVLVSAIFVSILKTNRRLFTELYARVDLVRGEPTSFTIRFFQPFSALTTIFLSIDLSSLVDQTQRNTELTLVKCAAHWGTDLFHHRNNLPLDNKVQYMLSSIFVNFGA